MLTIGKLARESGLSADALRYYEKERLLAPAKKTRAGYRLYGEDAMRRLAFIRHAQQCGFSLAETREMLELRSRERSCCRDVRNVAVAKRAELEARIDRLKELAQAIDRLIEACAGGDKSLEECPILGAFEATLQGVSPSSGPQGGRDTRAAEPGPRTPRSGRESTAPR